MIPPVREWRATVNHAPSTPPSAPGATALDARSLATAAGGQLLRAGRRPSRGGAVDSRRVEPGNLFFALPGARTDGHEFLGDAVANGATALVVSRPPSATALEALGDVTVVLVRDGLAALHAVAAAWRSRFSPLVVGVTGSLAKTSTKEAAAAVLGARRRVLASPGNENNEVGLPLTLLRLGPEHEAAVLEMGMYVEGEIATLAALARPQIGVVTAVRGVHLSRAGSIEAIEREKGRLVEALPPGGTAILNADDPRVRRMRDRTPARVVTYGFAEDADVGAEAIVPLGELGMRFTLRAGGDRSPAAIPTLGRHSLHNALAGAAVGMAAGLDRRGILEGLARGWTAPHRTALRDAGSIRILDDSYNAGPDSMAAALELLATLHGRRVAVLGEMLELGEASEAAHLALGRTAARTVELLVTVGSGARAVGAAAAAAGMPAARLHHAADVEAALLIVPALLRPGDIVLVKGSNEVGLDRLADQLVAAADAEQGRSE